MSNFVNPFMVFGFRRLFLEAFSKDVCIDFLNTILFLEFQADDGERIKDFYSLKAETLWSPSNRRNTVFDCFAETEAGEKVFVEILLSKHNFYKGREDLCSSFPIYHCVPKGQWNRELKKVYTISILDFVFSDNSIGSQKVVTRKDKFVHEVSLTEAIGGEIAYERLSCICLEIPKFSKSIDEVESHFEKWLYLFKHLPRLEQRPAKFHEQVFQRLFSLAEIDAFDPDVRQIYEKELKYFRDLNNVVETARQEGYAFGLSAGREQALREIALNLKNSCSGSE